MEVLGRINSICEKTYKIHEGDEYGIPRDCPIKRAYKIQMREAMYKRLVAEFNAHMLFMAVNRTPEQLVDIANNFLLSYESENVHQ